MNSKSRLEQIVSHLTIRNDNSGDTLILNPVAGELANQTTDESAHESSHRIFRYQYDRIPVKIWFQEEEDFKERYAGGINLVILEGELLKPKNAPTKTVLVFMHPMGIQNLLPLPMALARSGVHVITCTSRYPNNDSCLIMEKVVLDLGACVKYCKEKLGYEKVILAGWSGGGSLSAFYQSQAENPNVKSTPAGHAPDLTKANLTPADAVLQLAAHTSRAHILTEWLDPSIIDESNSHLKNVEFDLYNPQNPNQPPYTKEYVTKFRSAQVARNRKITKWVREKLAEIEKRNDGDMEHCFVVYGTMADPRWLDLSVDPNDRQKVNWCFMGIPKTVNNGPAGVARFCTLRSWLSQWSFDESQANGPQHLKRISVPILVIGNSEDDAVPLSHTHAIFNAICHDKKELHIVKGANHYYANQKQKQGEACEIILNFLLKYKLIEEQYRPPQK